MSSNKRLTVKRRSNLKTFLDYKKEGWDYIINPLSGELHSLKLSDYLGCHNLQSANLERFYPIQDIGKISIQNLNDGDLIDLFDADTGELITTYPLNKCSYCLKL